MIDRHPRLVAASILLALSTWCFLAAPSAAESLFEKMKSRLLGEPRDAQSTFAAPMLSGNQQNSAATGRQLSNTMSVPAGAVICSRSGNTTYYCQRGQRCYGNNKCAPSDAVICPGGSGYCDAGKKCWNNKCVAGDAVTCSDHVCDASMKCTSTGCAPRDAVVCSDGHYCDAGNKCVTLQGQIKCAAADAVVCTDGSGLCQAGDTCCAGTSSCCRSGTTCVPGKGCYGQAQIQQQQQRQQRRQFESSITQTSNYQRVSSGYGCSDVTGLGPSPGPSPLCRSQGGTFTRPPPRPQPQSPPARPNPGGLRAQLGWSILLSEIQQLLDLGRPTSDVVYQIEAKMAKTPGVDYRAYLGCGDKSLEDCLQDQIKKISGGDEQLPSPPPLPDAGPAPDNKAVPAPEPPGFMTSVQTDDCWELARIYLTQEFDIFANAVGGEEKPLPDRCLPILQKLEQQALGSDWDEINRIKDQFEKNPPVIPSPIGDGNDLVPKNNLGDTPTHQEWVPLNEHPQVPTNPN